MSDRANGKGEMERERQLGQCCEPAVYWCQACCGQDLLEQNSRCPEETGCSVAGNCSEDVTVLMENTPAQARCRSGTMHGNAIVIAWCHATQGLAKNRGKPQQCQSFAVARAQSCAEGKTGCKSASNESMRDWSSLSAAVPQGDLSLRGVRGCR